MLVVFAQTAKQKTLFSSPFQFSSSCFLFVIMGALYCCVTGCINNSRNVKRKGLQIYAFPSWKVLNNVNSSRIRQRNGIKRRNAWINAIDRKSLRLTCCSGVCSIHFVHGKPASIVDESHVDWVPTKFMNGEGHKHEKNAPPEFVVESVDTKHATGRHELRSNSDNREGSNSVNSVDAALIGENYEGLRMQFPNIVEWLPSLQTSFKTQPCQGDDYLHTNSAGYSDRDKPTDDISVTNATPMLSLALRDHSYSIMSYYETNNSSCCCFDELNEQTAGLKKDSQQAKEKLAETQEEISRLKKTITQLQNENKKYVEDSKLINVIRHNNEKTKFYTGLNTWSIFMAVFKLCKPDVETTARMNLFKCKITLEEQFLMTLMLLRLSLTMQDLAYRFDVSTPTVNRCFGKWIDAMYVRFAKILMTWPARDELFLSMPAHLRRHFPNSVQNKIPNARNHVEKVIEQLQRTFTGPENNLTMVERESDSLVSVDKITLVSCFLFNTSPAIVKFLRDLK